MPQIRQQVGKFLPPMPINARWHSSGDGDPEIEEANVNGCEEAESDTVSECQVPLQVIFSQSGSEDCWMAAFTTQPDWKAIFKELASRWKQERNAAGWVADMVTPAYQQIMGLGREIAVPMILEQLESEGNEPDHWFWALRVLTGADPVDDTDRGNLPRMAQAWLAWGRYQGYAG